MGRPRPPAGASAGDLGEREPDAGLATPTEPATAPPKPVDTGWSAEAKEKEDDRGGIVGFFRELPGLIILAFALALIIKTFLIQAFFIPSQSMVPTLKVGDRVLVNKVVYNVGEPQRGDIIVFENPQLVEPDRGVIEAIWNWLIEGLGFSVDPTKDFIKRVVGLPGETIEIREGQVFVDGQPIEEPYLRRTGRDSLAPTLVEPDHLFVMGDNRPNSQDSRSALGQIPVDKVVGKAFVLLWPPSRVEWLSDD
jgi:signal peptidase I